MYSNNPRRPAPKAPSRPKSPYFVPEEDAQKPALIFGTLCLLLPPVGIVCAWRSRRMTFPLRLILSGVGFAAMTLIFFLMMRPAEVVSTIRPTPVVPMTAGYGTMSANEYTAAQQNVSDQPFIPAQPDAVSPSSSYTEPLIQSSELNDYSIVYAVTNNASSYHIYEMCDFQQNNRALTLREALNEGLQPCSKCVGTAE